MFRFTTLTIFALAATFVAAQDTTTTTTSASAPVSTCIINCSTDAATAAGCTNYTDFQCVCNSPQFQSSALNCLTLNCPDEVAAATALQQLGCSGVSSSAISDTTSGTGTGSTSAPTTTGGSTSGPSTTGSKSSSSGTGTPTSNTASTSRATASTTGAAFQNAPVAGAMGALAALVGAAIF